MTNIVIIGTGMGGCGASYRLAQEGVRPVVYDKHSYFGGHTASFEYESGFVFDAGPHISFTKDPRIQQLLADAVEGQFETVQVRLNNYWRGHWPRHPVQLHLHGLPDDVVVKVIADFVAEQQSGEREIRNYADWLLASYGRAFAEFFPMRYTRKFHLTEAENLSTDWLGPRMYRPTLEEMLHGALSSSAPTRHYVTHFRYPTRGGFGSYLRKLAPLTDPKLGHEVVAIDPRLRELTLAHGERVRYDALVSSVPLPELIPMITGAPLDVVDAARRLACSTCVVVNLGVGRPDLSGAHVTYFYDEDICFSRLNFPHMLSPHNVPEGAGSIQAEVYFSSKYRPLTVPPDSLIEPVIADLQRCGILRPDDCIMFRNAMLLPYANIIFDLECSAASKTVHGYLDDIGVAYCGRYGDWRHLWTDESFISGERAAETALALARGRGHSRSTTTTAEASGSEAGETLK